MLTIRSASQVHDYESAAKYLGSKTERPLCNNTRVIRRSDKSIAVRLHATDVLTYDASGATTFDTGGWNTVTTRQRINQCSAARMTQVRGVSYINDVPFKDGCKLVKGRIVGAGSTASAGRQDKLARSIAGYSKEYVDRLVNGEIPAPSGADCWFCAMFDQAIKPGGKSHDAEHLQSHIKEHYYVPSLIVSAVNAMGGSMALKDWIARRWQGSTAEPDGLYRAGNAWAITQARTTLRRFMRKSMGLSA